MKKLLLAVFLLLGLCLSAQAKLTLKEIRTASNNVIELFFNSDQLDVNEVSIQNPDL